MCNQFLLTLSIKKLLFCRIKVFINLTDNMMFVSDYKSVGQEKFLKVKNWNSTISGKFSSGNVSTWSIIENLLWLVIVYAVKYQTHILMLYTDVEQGSSDNLSSSCGSGSSASRSHSFNAHPSPPRSIEHVLVFPTGNDSSWLTWWHSDMSHWTYHWYRHCQWLQW